MSDQDKQVAELNELINSLISIISENSGKLDTMSSLFAKTTAATENAVIHTRTLADNSDWGKRGKAIAAVMTKALEKDHSALHAASRAANEMRSLSIELTRKTDRAAEAQMDGGGRLYAAAQHLQEAQERLEAGRWRRMGAMALTGALCVAIGFFAREPAAKYTHLFEAGTALRQDAFGTECKGVRGESFTNDGRSGCVVWQDPS